VIRQDQGHCAAQSGGGTVIGRPHPDPAGKRTFAQREFNLRANQMPCTGDLADDDDFSRRQRCGNHAHASAEVFRYPVHGCHGRLILGVCQAQ